MTRLSGWGRTTSSVSDVASPTDASAVSALLAPGRPTLARGLGRSYGDAAMLAGGLVLDNRSLGGISAIDENGVVTVGAGVSMDELLRQSIPQGWFIPVTPGTRQVTIGGAVAADVHGKNHHLDGSFGAHVTSLTLVAPTGIHEVGPDHDAELFWATVGGMGLTGVITQVTLRMLPIESDRVLVDTTRHSDLDSVMSAMIEGDAAYRYSVAWVDCMTKGRSLGRGILTRGDHARKGGSSDSLRAPGRTRLSVPVDAPSGLLNPLTIKAFNELWFRHAPKNRQQEPTSIGSFFHPLDGVANWNRLYGRRGFVQYQFVVPDESADTVRVVIEKLVGSRVPSFLAVLKRFGPANPAPLSFPTPGWTLALDLPVGPRGLPSVLDELDRTVVDAGGRLYFAKDSRLDPGLVRAMYPRLEEFLAVKHRVDPEGQFTSDLARRLTIGEK